MVIKGSARGGAGELASHLLREDTNEIVRVREFHNVAALTLPEALAELDGMGAGSRSKRSLYHASINTTVDEQLTPEQRWFARKRLAEELGLSQQPFVVVEHVKHGRQHTHIVWSRIDVETGKAIPDSHNYRKHEIVSRELEIEFGHEPVLGVHVRNKDLEPRPERGPTWGEQRQAERSGLTPEEAKRQVTELWKQTATGNEFVAALAGQGWTLARGDRRDFVLIDSAGEVHSLVRRINGIKAAQVRDRMADVDDDELPMAKEAQQQARQPKPEPSPVVEGGKPQIEEQPLAMSEPEPSTINQESPSILYSLFRPLDRLFVLCFGVVVDAYQKVYDAACERLLGEKPLPQEELAELERGAYNRSGPSMGF